MIDLKDHDGRNIHIVAKQYWCESVITIHDESFDISVVMPSIEAAEAAAKEISEILRKHLGYPNE